MKKERTVKGKRVERKQEGMEKGRGQMTERKRKRAQIKKARK
jgi:hypothetical protein